MDGAEKALTEIAEPLARLFERWTGIGVDPAFCAAVIAMSLVLVAGFACASLAVLARRVWVRRLTGRSARTTGKSLTPHDPARIVSLATIIADPPVPGAVAPVVVAPLVPMSEPPAHGSATEHTRPADKTETAPAPSPIPRHARKIASRRATPRLLAARKVRDAVLKQADGPEWSVNSEVAALRSLEMRSIEGVKMRIELMAPEAGAPIYTLNIWSDGAKVFNFEWSAEDERAEKLRFMKAGDWADDVAVWRFAPFGPAQIPRRAEGGR